MTRNDPRSDAPTQRFADYECDHIDLCGDTLIEAQGEQQRCIACGKSWRIDTVIVNDETL